MVHTYSSQVVGAGSVQTLDGGLHGGGHVGSGNWRLAARLEMREKVGTLFSNGFGPVGTKMVDQMVGQTMGRMVRTFTMVASKEFLKSFLKCWIQTLLYVPAFTLPMYCDLGVGLQQPQAAYRKLQMAC